MGSAYPTKTRQIKLAATITTVDRYLTRKHIEYSHRFLVTVETAAVLLNRDSGAFHLAGTCLAPQLGNQFVNLGEPGRRNGMAAGFQAA